MVTNGNAIPVDDFVSREEFFSGMQEQVENIQDVMKVVNLLKNKINTQSEVLGCHRYILARFVPIPLLEQAVKDYVKERGEELDLEIRARLTKEFQGDGQTH